MQNLTRLLIVIPLMIVGGFTLFQFAQFFTPDKGNTPTITKKPSVTHLSLNPGEKIQDYTLFELPGELNKAEIHDIIFLDGSMWMGTDKGLVRIEGDNVTVYKQFSDWPFEWIKDLAVTPYGIAVQTYVASGNTGGHSAGSYVFDVNNEAWHPIGRNILAQAWLDGYLYQATSKLIRRSPLQDWKEEEVVHRICVGRVASLKMRTIVDELWLTGDWTTTGGRSNDGCGVVRYNPKTGKSLFYKTKDGLNHDMGWDLGGDSRDVYVTHSIKYAFVSRFEQDQQQWVSMKTAGTGNRITVTTQAIWLAAPVPTHPLIRIDRNTGEKLALPPLSDKEYVSAIGANGKEIWFGTYVKSWSGSTYTIRSRLGRYIEQH